MITLRGHHLLCALNYSGSGYTPEFISTFDDICRRMTAGEEIRLTWTSDSICQPMIGHPQSHCRQPRIYLRDFFGFLSASLALRMWLWPGRRLVLTADKVARLRQCFHSKMMRIGCAGCEWFGHCTQNARGGYAKSRLYSKS